MELVDRGFRPKQSLIDQWIQTPMPPDALARFMNSDLKDTSLPTIPEDFDNNSTSLPSMVLQIVDAVDIGNSTHSLLSNLEADNPVRQVYKKKGDVQFPRHTLRWTLSDGYKQVPALEYEPIPELDLLTPFGCKLLIKTCQVRHGILFLTPSSVTVYGGQVSSLYDGDMLATLERRFNERLRMPAQVPPAEHQLTWQRPTSLDSISDVKKNGDFDKKMEQITQDFAALDSQHTQTQSRYRTKSAYDASTDNATYDSSKRSTAYDSYKRSTAYDSSEPSIRYGSPKGNATYDAPRPSAIYSASQDSVPYNAPKDNTAYDSSWSGARYGSFKDSASEDSTPYDASKGNAAFDSSKRSTTYDSYKRDKTYSSSKYNTTYSSSRDNAMYNSSRDNATYNSSRDNTMYNSFRDNTTYDSPKPRATYGSPKDNTPYNSYKPGVKYGSRKDNTPYSSYKPSATYGSPKENTSYNSYKPSTTYGSPKENTSYSSSMPSTRYGASNDSATEDSPEANQDRISKETTRMELANFQFSK
ncbi:hypothetical protein BJV82DRAFT_582512 [Fennellomyces sp. T-0311]|nr:hypothetical protein BJV82DRAFT_582512 [Fennellomyces sp. T-0311]